MDAPIDEIVSLLVRDAPTEIKRLRGDFPEHQDLLREGIVAGTADSTDAGQKKAAAEKEAAVKKAAAIDALKQATTTYRSLLPRLMARITSARRLALYGQVATIVAGATIVANAATVFPVAVKVGCGLLALSASLLGLVSHQRITPVGDEHSSLYVLYRKLVEAGVMADSLMTELSMNPPVEAKALNSFIGQVNSTCKRINEVAPYLTDANSP
jgi:hypothetical protein